MKDLSTDSDQQHEENSSLGVLAEIQAHREGFSYCSFLDQPQRLSGLRTTGAKDTRPAVDTTEDLPLPPHPAREG